MLTRKQSREGRREVTLAACVGRYLTRLPPTIKHILKRYGALNSSERCLALFAGLRGELSKPPDYC